MVTWSAISFADPEPTATPAHTIRAERRRAEQLGRDWHRRRDAMTAALAAAVAARTSL